MKHRQFQLLTIPRHFRCTLFAAQISCLIQSRLVRALEGDAGGRVVRVAASDSLDELSAMIASKQARAADLAAMRARVGAEMAAAMDTGVRVNAALAQALGVDVPARLRSEGDAGGAGASAQDSDMSDASSEMADESNSDGFGA